MARHFAAESLSDGGRALIARMYEDGESFVDILAELKATHGEELGLSSLHRYCTQILALEQKRKQAIKTRARAMIEFARENPDCNDAQIAQSLIYQALLENQNNLQDVNLPFLLQEQRRREEGQGRMEIERLKIGIERERNDLERQLLELKRDAAVKIARTAEEVVSQVKAKGLTEEAAAEIRKKILGINE